MMDKWLCPKCHEFAKPTRTGPTAIGQLAMLAGGLASLVFAPPVGVALLVALPVYSRRKVTRRCAHCGSDEIVPGDSVEAARMVMGGK